MLRTFEAQNGFKIRTLRLRKKLDVLIKKKECNRYVLNSTVAANSTEENQNDTALTFVITAKCVKTPIGFLSW